MIEFPRLSNPAIEGHMAVSKALKFQVLLDTQEMQDLLKSLSSLRIFLASSVVQQEEAEVSIAQFLEIYTNYVSFLKQGIIPDEKTVRPFFSSLFTTHIETLYAHEVKENGYLIKPLKPIIQLQAHHFFYSELDKKFHPMVLSDKSVTCGIQFSYPQIYQHPKSAQFSKVKVSSEFPNTALFLELRRWLKENSLPTPFLHEGVKTFVPIRLGKKCFSWINKHPQLRLKSIEVFV